MSLNSFDIFESMSAFAATPPADRLETQPLGVYLVIITAFAVAAIVGRVRHPDLGIRIQEQEL